ncbi:hypothetical protein BDV59DRAFT_188623 [Aspergillus ambiguus]|uniref:uncharacterized protein n=1 Tax=Aspergillus ambiguus TaxID=176160 RepID=UPI003CCD864B
MGRYHIVGANPPGAVVFTDPESEVVLTAVVLDFQVHDHAETGLHPDEIAVVVVDERTGLGVEAAARGEQDVTVFAAGIPVQDIDLGGLEVEGFILDGRMGTEEAQFIPETVPEGRGQRQAEEEAKEEHCARPWRASRGRSGEARGDIREEARGTSPGEGR